MIEPSIQGNEVHLPLSNDARWSIVEGICKALADDDDVAQLMLNIADAANDGERATYSLMKLEAKAGITYAALRMTPIEARILADDLLYITPETKETLA